MWSGKPARYDNLKVFGCVAYAHTKTDKLEPRALKCTFVGYPEGVKGYKLWFDAPGKSKCSISRDVTFNESQMGRVQKGQNIDLKQSSATGNLQIEVEQAASSFQDCQAEILEKESLERSGEEINLENLNQGGADSYNLVRDRQMRVIKPSQRYGQAEMTAFALTVVEEEIEMKPKSYQDAIKSKEAGK